MTTGPCSSQVLPSAETHSQPHTSPLLSVRSLVTFVFTDLLSSPQEASERTPQEAPGAQEL